MDIKPIHNQTKTATPPAHTPGSKTDLLKLKLNQTLPLKVISFNQESQSIILQSTRSKQSIRVQSNLPVKLKPNQILFLTVNKTDPTIEFTIAAQNTDNKNFNRQKHPTTKQSSINSQLVKLTVIAETEKTNSLQLNKTEFNAVQSIKNPQQIILDTVKNLLPIQNPPSDIVNLIIQNLAQLNQNKNLSDNLKQLAEKILHNLPQTKNLASLNQLQNSFRNSGLFLEANLASLGTNKDITFSNDLKNLLLNFHLTLKQELKANQKQNENKELSLLKDMAKNTQNALAKITLNQLSSLPKEESNRQAWLLDLPILNNGRAETVKMEIEKDHQANNDEKKPPWKVKLTITPPNFGTIHCSISSVDQTINTCLWSESDDIVSTIKQHLDYLKDQFTSAGIVSVQLSAQTRKTVKESQTLLSTQNLINQKI